MAGSDEGEHALLSDMTVLRQVSGFGTIRSHRDVSGSLEEWR